MTPTGSSAGATPPGAAPPVPVSVVIPAYGHADYVVTAVESALQQSPPPLEVIVIDDSSPDDTADRVAPLVRAGRVRYVWQANTGMAGARNAGARLAAGEYIHFLDDDDVLLPGALRVLVSEIERHPAAAIAFGHRVFFQGDPPVVPEQEAAWRPAELAEFLCLNPIISPGQALIRRTAFEAVGGFDRNIWGSDDWDLWLRLLGRFPGRMGGPPVLAYRRHAGSASHNALRMYRSSLRVSGPALRRLSPHARRVIQRTTYRQFRVWLGPVLWEQVRRSVRAGEWRTAAAASKAWWHVHALAVGALVGYRVHLLARGQLRLPDSDPLKAVLSRQSF